MDFKFRRASLDATSDATIILSMLDSFKMDASNKKNIVKETGSALVESLKAYNNSIIYFVELNNKPIGMAICFKSFSTFKAAQLLNIHDFYVTLDYQNRGIGGSLLKHIESDARKCGFCGITLEVKAGNTRALKVYENHGFSGNMKTATTDIMYFMSKEL